MANFRTNTPKRRPITRVVNSYSDHKADLRIDFSERCGYCNSLDTWKLTYFEIDHFIPQKRNKVQFLTIKSNTDYSNLVYSCRSCNNAKSNKWPTGDQNIPNRNDEGFVDPCDNTFNAHFERTANGQINYSTNLGKWMHKALNFNKPQHEILWNLEELRKMIDEIEALNTKLNSQPAVQLSLLNTYRNFVKYVDQLRAL